MRRSPTRRDRHHFARGGADAPRGQVQVEAKAKAKAKTKTTKARSARVKKAAVADGPRAPGRRGRLTRLGSTTPSALLSMNRRLGSTSSPMSGEKISSALIASSTCT